MNKRLARDAVAGNDPAAPKILFPSAKQCPKCYLPTVQNTNLENLAEHESPFQDKEVLLFLSSFYSKYHIQPIQTQSNKKANLNDNNNNNNDLKESTDAGGKRIMLPDQPDAVIDNPSNIINVNMDDEAYDEARLKSQDKLNKILEDRRRNLDMLLIEQNYNPNSQNTIRSDVKLGLYAVGLVVLVFVLLYFYFAQVRQNKTKLKKHIV